MDYLRGLTEKYPALRGAAGDIAEAFSVLKKTYADGGKLLVCGNGGSAADAEHIVGELMKGFYKQRPLPEAERRGMEDLAPYLQGALPAIALTGHPALATAFLNDVHPKMVFAQQVYGYGRPGDALLAISTSGNSENVLNAAKVAKARGLSVIGMTGRDGGALRTLADVCIVVPGEATAEIQEYHLPVYHALCAMLEEAFFKE